MSPRGSRDHSDHIKVLLYRSIKLGVQHTVHFSQEDLASDCRSLNFKGNVGRSKTETSFLKDSIHIYIYMLQLHPFDQSHVGLPLVFALLLIAMKWKGLIRRYHQ